MSDMHDALNKLAGRGKERGFDEVLAGATESAERARAERTSVEGGAGGDDLDVIPFVTEEPAVRRRRPLGTAIAAAGIAALVLVGGFAVSAMVGNSGSGSGSPEGAVRRLADAISHSDPLAAADVLAPDEVRSLSGTINAAAKKAAEIQLVNDAGAPLAGVEFDVSGLKLTTQSLGDGYAKVTVDGGSLSASTHKTQFSALMQKVLRDTGDNSAHYDLAKLESDNNLPTFVVAVREDGHWYVSVAYTALEYWREYNRLPAADFGSGVDSSKTLGAATPDAAVQDAMHALQAQDWTTLISLAPPSEIPVYDYRAAIAAELGANGSTKSTFTISSMTTDSQVDGATAKVSLHASGTTDSGRWSFDGGCFTGAASEPLGGPCGTGILAPGLLGMATTGVNKDSRITVAEENGRWFVSPVGTVLDVVDGLITQLDKRSLYITLNIPNEIPPDGSLTLGQPVVLHAGTTQNPQVLTFAGHKDENLLGLALSNDKTISKSSFSGFGSGNVRVFAPDGSELDEAAGMLNGSSLTLPADGNYTFVIDAYAVAGVDVTVTIWDAAHAPAAAKVQNGDTGLCTYGIGSESCSSTSVTVEPGSTPGSICKILSGSAPISGETVPRYITLPVPSGEIITACGQNGGGVVVSGSASSSSRTNVTVLPTVPQVTATSVGSAATAVAPGG